MTRRNLSVFPCISWKSSVLGTIGAWPNSDTWQVIRENDELHLVFEFMEVPFCGDHAFNAVNPLTGAFVFLWVAIPWGDEFSAGQSLWVHEIQSPDAQTVRGLSQDAKVTVLDSTGYVSGQEPLKRFSNSTWPWTIPFNFHLTHLKQH